MKKITLLFILVVTSSCSENKPTLCECHDSFMNDASNALYNGNSTPSSKTNICSKYYTTEQMAYADETDGC